MPGYEPDRARLPVDCCEHLCTKTMYMASEDMDLDRYEEIDDLPRRLRGTEAPRPPRAAPPQGEAGRGQVPATTPAARGSLQRAAAEEAGELTDAELEELDIVLYSTSWCGYCRKARRYFQDKGYPFVEKDIEQDRAAAAAFQQIAGRRGGVPVIVINGQVLRGFSPGHIDRAVGRALRGGG